MNTVTDHNLLLETALLSNDRETISRILACSLTPTSVLELVRKTGNYDNLTLFKDFLNHNTEEAFLPLCVDAIRDGTFDGLKKYLPKEINKNSLSRACAEADVDFQLIPFSLQEKWAYIRGLIKTDNLQSLLKFLPNQIADRSHILQQAGSYGAMKIMSHYGFSSENLETYLWSAFSTNNKTTLAFLSGYKEETEKTFFAYLERFQYYRTCFPTECFQEGIITLSEEGWQRLKKNYPEFYKSLTPDV